MSTDKKSERLDYLDAIRGVAASIVVLHHCWLASDSVLAPSRFGTAFHSPSNLVFYCVGKFLAGRAAVMVFFVLSGFVLTYSLQKHPVPYLGYTVKRFFRIYPAFIFAIALSYAVHCLIGVEHGVASEWLTKEILGVDLSVGSLTKHLLMWGTRESEKLDGVMWSLVHEMRISLIFPLIFFSVRKTGKYAVASYLLVSLIATLTLFYLTGNVAKGGWETTVWASFCATAYFMVFFAIGSLLALERKRIAAMIADLDAWKTYAASVIMLGCLFYPNPTVGTLDFTIVDYMHGLGATLLICMALGKAALAESLKHPVLVWLGRVSYSLYLVHIPIIYALNQTIGGSWSFLELSAIAGALSLLAAEAMFRMIELPGIRLGKGRALRAVARS